MPDGWFSFYAPKDLVIHTATPETLIPAVRQIIRAADPALPISDVRTLAAVVDRETARRSVQLRIIGAFAAIAFLLAAIGIHGLLAFAVSQRSNEIGVRIALGAQRHNILGMVLRQGALLAAAGVLPGAAAAYVAGRAMESILAGVKPADSGAFLAAIGLAVVMTLAGSLLPAWRAARVDPIRAIRAE
jgi:putative ABC transport system permease protein